MDTSRQAGSTEDRMGGQPGGTDAWTDDALREAQAAERPKVVIDPSHQPSWGAQQFYRFANTAFSCATISLLRTLANPPKPPAPPNADTLPAWYVEEYKKKAMFKGYGAQYMRDTLILTAAAYLMGGVEYGLSTLRGTDDVLNKTVAGVAAGSFVGHFWFPGRPHARVMMASTGALVGYVGFTMERTAKGALLEQQRLLEKEVLGVDDQGTKKELDTAYLRELMVMRQKQIADVIQAHQQSGHKDGPLGQAGLPRAGPPGPPGFAASGPGASTPPFPGPAAYPGTGRVGPNVAGTGQAPGQDARLPWEVPQQASQDRLGAGGLAGVRSVGGGVGGLGDGSSSMDGGSDFVSDAAAAGGAVPGNSQAQQQAAARRGWWLGGRAGPPVQKPTPATAQGGVAGMEIREEEDRNDFGAGREAVGGGFTIVEEPDVPRR